MATLCLNTDWHVLKLANVQDNNREFKKMLKMVIGSICCTCSVPNSQDKTIKIGRNNLFSILAVGSPVMVAPAKNQAALPTPTPTPVLFMKT